MYFEEPKHIRTVCPYCGHIEEARHTGDKYSGVAVCGKCVSEYAYKISLEVVSTSSRVEWLPTHSLTPKTKLVVSDIPKTPIKGMFSLRAVNTLLKNEVTTLEILLTYSEVGLLKMPLMGKKVLTEIKDALAMKDLSLRSNSA